YDHYSDLLVSHKAIQKDEKQLELLTPIIKNRETLYLERVKKENLDFIDEQMQFYLNKVEGNLLTEDIERIEHETGIFKEDERLTSEKIKSLERDKEQLIAQRAALNIDSQIALLNQKLISETDKRNTKSTQSKRY